jgi:hypothetical protein
MRMATSSPHLSGPDEFTMADRIAADLTEDLPATCVRYFEAKYFLRHRHARGDLRWHWRSPARSVNDNIRTTRTNADHFLQGA